MHRISWRKTLPIAQFAAYILLIWYGCWYRPTWQHWLQKWVSPSSESAFYPSWIDGIEPVPEQVADGINFPAVIAATLTILPFDDLLHNGASKELAMHVVTAMYVPLLWFLIGKRLDRRTTIKANLVSKRMRALSVVAMVGLLLAGILMPWAFSEGQRYAMSGLALFWIIGGIVAIRWQLCQPREHTPR